MLLLLSPNGLLMLLLELLYLLITHPTALPLLLQAILLHAAQLLLQLVQLLRLVIIQTLQALV